MERKHHGKKLEGLMLVNETDARGKPNDIDLILDDGSVATIHEEGERFLLTLYQSRISGHLSSYSALWDDLSRGKCYIREYDQRIIDSNIIKDALNWLSMLNSGLELYWLNIKNYDDAITDINSFLHGEHIPNKYDVFLRLK